MKIVKYLFLEMLLLCAMIVCSTIAMKVMEMLFNLNYKNIFESSFMVGFIAWLVLLVIALIIFIKKKR